MSWNPFKVTKLIPSQQAKIHAHSFLGPELGIQYTYTYKYLNNAERHRFWIRCTYPVLFALSLTDTNTHMWKRFLANEFEFKTNTHTSRNRQEYEMYLFPAHGINCCLIHNELFNMCRCNTLSTSCLPLGPCCGSSIARIPLVRNPVELDSVSVSS